MSSQPYGILVEDNENDSSDTETTDESSKYASHCKSKDDSKCNENDCDITICSTPELPHLLENTEGDIENKCFQNTRDITEAPPVQTR